MPQRQALVVGATGLVGRAVCAQLVADSTYSAVHALVRQAGHGLDARIVAHPVDFGHLDNDVLPAVDDVYCCLGTTIAEAGSRDAFRRVDYLYVLDCARALHAVGAKRFALVSALGGDPGSRMFYSRTKGEVERDLEPLGFQLLVVARPSLLSGGREAIGQRRRPAEAFTLKLVAPISKLVPARYRPVPAAVLAHALIATMKSASGPLVVLESDELQRFAPSSK
jgi:uncharacterized protein YbjT (DUF2867 family)